MHIFVYIYRGMIATRPKSFSIKPLCLYIGPHLFIVVHHNIYTRSIIYPTSKFDCAFPLD